MSEGKTVKNRLHLDVRVAAGLEGDERMSALKTETDRLEALGATRAYTAATASPSWFVSPAGGCSTLEQSMHRCGMVLRE